jgi:hypothetical protein
MLLILNHIGQRIGDNGLVCQCNINDRLPFEAEDFALKVKATSEFMKA